MIIESPEALERAAADGKISQHDADAVRKFQEWLGNSGPTLWEHKTEEQQQWCRDAYADPEWREYLGLPPLPVSIDDETSI